MSDVVQVATTCDSEVAANAMARNAVGARLAACAQVEGPITSTYRWQGEVETTAEWRVTYKTTTASADALEAFVLEHHPYETPEVLRTPVVGGNPAYLSWVRDAVDG
jgi:periplasmic divalent cation tolerance protein